MSEPAAGTDGLAVMLTRRCTMACSHCSVESSPGVNDPQPPDKSLRALVRQAAAAGIRTIQFTGGEPLLRPRLLEELIALATGLGMLTSLSTNGFWGKSANAARKQLGRLQRAGLKRLTVSYDRFHAEFQGPEPALNIVAASGELAMPITINITRMAGEDGLEQIVAPFRDQPHVVMRFYDVQPVGAAARTLADQQWRAQVSGFCNACEQATVTDDGRIMACNGPSYFTAPDNPLHVGRLSEHNLGELLRAHREDPVLDTLRTFGPERLRRELADLPGFEAFPFRGAYRGMCDLCLQITSDPRAADALRQHLATPRLAAERQAMRQLITASRRSGQLGPVQVNGEQAARVFHHALTHPEQPWPAAAGRLLGRADFDWARQGRMLTACGLARPLLPLLDDPALRAWAPDFFNAQLREVGLRDGLRELAQREALRRIDLALQTLALEGVLLKGTAILALQRGAGSLRASGDIDLWVAPEQAEVLRAHLLADGFSGQPEAPRTAPHHLAPVFWRGVPVEIHTRIMPACWGLPEREMLGRRQRLPGEDLPALRSLCREGMVLHAISHLTTHLFAFGSKAGWDVALLMRTATVPIDWDLVQRWAEASRVPRAFWVPARVLNQHLDLGLPAELLLHAPNDTRQRQLERIARHRLFLACETTAELNPLSRTAVTLLLHDGLRRRLGYARWWLGPEAAIARRTARRLTPNQGLAGLAGHSREAFRQFRRFRRTCQEGGS
jgi:hypothetical protein